MINADRTERTAHETNCPKQHSMQTRIDYFVFVSVYLSSSKRLRITTTNCLECSVEYEQHFHFNEIHLSKFQTYPKQKPKQKIYL